MGVQFTNKWYTKYLTNLTHKLQKKLIAGIGPHPRQYTSGNR